MNKELQKMTEQWMSLERKTMEQRQQAEKFYANKLMSLIVEDYIDRNSDLVYEEVKYLVVSVGTSYEPIVLNIKLLNPEKVLFLYTEASTEVIDDIVAMCELKNSEYEKSKVSEVNPLDIYSKLRKSLFLKCQQSQLAVLSFENNTK